MAVLLGRADLSLAEARSLKPGDVLTLDSTPDEPLAVLVEGQPKYFGWPCTSAHGNNAVKVAGEVAAEREGDHSR